MDGILKDSLAQPQLFGFSLFHSLSVNLPGMSVAQMSSMEHLNTTWLAEQHDKLVFLGLNLLKLTPISVLVWGNWQKSRVWKAKISPKGGGWSEMEAKGREQVKIACRLQSK